jgi:enterochelin esterase-like enzyme
MTERQKNSPSRPRGPGKTKKAAKAQSKALGEGPRAAFIALRHSSGLDCFLYLPLQEVECSARNYHTDSILPIELAIMERSIAVRFTHILADNSISFFYPYADKEKVFVIGDFNNWELPGMAMHPIDQEGWELITDPLPPGEYSYKFLADGEWCRDPHNALSYEDGFGDRNSLIYNREDRGSIHHFTFYSPALGAERWYLVYLPPHYFREKKPSSTLYLIHGALDWEWTWLEKASVNKMLDGLIREGRIGEFIVVMPRENADLYRGDHRFGTYLAQDLLGHVDFEFRTIDSPHNRAVDGLSTGGFNAFYLGALHPDSFASVGAMSGTFNELSYELVLENKEQMKLYSPRFVLNCGSGDSGRESSRNMARFLTQLGFPVERHENHGPHEWTYWREHYPVNLEFHWQSFKR